MYNKKFNERLKKNPELFKEYDFDQPKGDYTAEQKAMIEKSLSPLARKLLVKNRGA